MEIPAEYVINPHVLAEMPGPLESFPKIARWSRDIIITEKLDGTNASIYIPDFPYDEAHPLPLYAGSRSRYITSSDDNFGFARWVEAHAEELRGLGPGRHFGEWWGSGIQRGYGLTKGEKRFSLFNIHRWFDRRAAADNRLQIITEKAAPCPECCSVVPILYYGPLGHPDFGGHDAVRLTLRYLAEGGSIAAPGFTRPEGIVIYHTASRTSFKKTIEKDDAGKGREE